jgi:hypothetical protein
MIRPQASALVILGLVLSVGCGGDSKIAPVSGRVLVNGEPKAGLIVVFQPIGSKSNPNPGKGSSGKTDADGRFTLSVDDRTSGAVVGEHKVAIFTALSDRELRANPETGSADGAPPGPRETIPPRYNDLTELKFTVPKEGTDKADFDLKTDAPTKGKGKSKS